MEEFTGDLSEYINNTKNCGNALITAEDIPDIYRVFFDLSNDALYLYRVEQDGTLGRFIDVNQETCRRLGYSKEEFLSLTPNDIAHPDRIPGYKDLIEKLIAEKIFLVETEHVSKNGKIIPVEVSSHLFGVNDGYVVFAIARDIKKRKIYEAKLRKRSMLLINKIHQRTQAIESITEKLKREIDERKNTERALKDSEELFRAMSDTVPVLIYRTGVDKSLNYFNRGWLEFTGRKMEEEAGEGWHNSIYPDDLPSCLEAYNSAFDKRISFNIEYRLRRFDGQYRWVLDHGTPQFSSDGTFLGYFGSCIDITERRAAEEEARHKAAVQNVINTILSFPIEEITLDEILNRSLKLIAGVPWYKDKVNGGIYLKDEESGRLFLKAYMKQLEYEQIKCGESYPDFCHCGGDSYKGITECASSMDVEIQQEQTNQEQKHYCIPINSGSSMLGIICISAKDAGIASENEDEFLKAVAAYLSGVIIRKQNGDALKKLSMVAEQSADLVLITDKSGKIEYVNKAFEELTGYTKIDWKDKTPRILKSGMHEPSKYKEMWEHILSGKVMRGVTVNRKKSGESYFEEKTITPLKDNAGNITHFVSTGRDITERVKAEAELRQAKERAEISERLKSDFLAQMSHEIRTPINSILNFTSLLKSELIDKVPDELKDFFVYIDKGGRRLIRTIDLILNMSQVQSGGMTVRPVKIDLEADIVKEILPELLPSANEKNLKLDFVNCTGGAFILGDLYTVRQIFENIIDNAIKFTFKGKVEITLFRSPSNEICASILDTGIGISEDYLPKLFNPFSQEETGYSRRFEGNGLGLALVRKYIELNSASIEVESKKGEGTCFTLSFKSF